MAEQFADLSHHQATFTPAAYKAAGHKTVALKATEGTGYTDPTFTARWKAAGGAGLHRVAYNYSRAMFSGADEFDHLLGVVQAAGGLGPQDLLCQDVEDTNYPAGAAANARQFGARALARGYPTGLVYTGVWYATPNRVTPGLYPPGWRNLWIADYTASHADATVPLPTGWTRGQCFARQFTDKANVGGIGSSDYSRLLTAWPNTTVEDDMFEDADRTNLAAVKTKMDTLYTQVIGAVGSGQRDFQGTVEAILGGVQATVNLVNQKTGALAAAITDVKTATLTAVATIPTAHLSDAEQTALAQRISEFLATQNLTIDPAALAQALSEDLAGRLST